MYGETDNKNHFFSGQYYNCLFCKKYCLQSWAERQPQGRADLKVENTYILINQSADIYIDNKCEECDKKVKLITTMHHKEKEPM